MIELTIGGAKDGAIDKCKCIKETSQHQKHNHSHDVILDLLGVLADHSLHSLAYACLTLTCTDRTLVLIIKVTHLLFESFKFNKNYF